MLLSVRQLAVFVDLIDNLRVGLTWYTAAGHDNAPLHLPENIAAFLSSAIGASVQTVNETWAEIRGSVWEPASDAQDDMASSLRNGRHLNMFINYGLPLQIGTFS